MRPVEFLVEYTRDATAENYGDKLLAAFAKVPAWRVPDDLYGFKTIISVYMDPESYTLDRPIILRTSIGNLMLSKQNYIEQYEQIKPFIVNDILYYLEQQDPTPTKKYIFWMIRAFSNDPTAVSLEDINQNNMLKAYDIAKRTNQLQAQDKDIGKFRTFTEFRQMMRGYDIPKILQLELDKSTPPIYDVLLDDDQVQVIHPKNETASRKFGSPHWCTASYSNNRFSEYNKRGPLYIITTKRDGEKYQFHFQSEQFMDENDDPIDHHLLMHRYPQLIEVFSKEFRD
jgi:hypothetical protein